MSERLFINVIGHPGSGKSTLVDALKQRYGFEVYRPSDTVRSFARERGIPLNGRADYVVCHRQLCEEDPRAMVRPILESDNNVCIDGLRVLLHARHLQQKVDMKTLALDCKPEECFRRIKAAEEWRAYRDNTKLTTFEDYLRDREADEDNTHPFDPNVSQIIAMHDLLIDTTSLSSEQVMLEAGPFIDERLTVAP